MNASRSVLSDVEATMLELRSKLHRTDVESTPLSHSLGRILAASIVSFRDSPPSNVSAMDGYAMSLATTRLSSIPVKGIASAGAAPLQSIDGEAIKIFTGGVVPTGADVVVRREDCMEQPTPTETSAIEIRVSSDSIRAGQNIRYRAENVSKGTVAIRAGVPIGPQTIAGLATFSESDQVPVFRKLRVGIINTGDELVAPGLPAEDWQIRDSNGPLLQSLLASQAWAETSITKTPDNLDRIQEQLQTFLVDCDAVLLTGGVSMGDSDHVPEAVVRSGSTIAFHKIPIRPGKPLLGAISKDRKLILGLPGNPVSVAVTYRRFALPLLEWMAGVESPNHGTEISFQCSDQKTLPLIWYRLVSLDTNGRLMIDSTQGSGDISSLAKSDGFIEIPPHETSSGMRKYFSWH